MSTDDLNSRETTQSKGEVAPGSPREKKIAPGLARDAEEEETPFRQRRASPALRLSAWLFAFVLLLVILGWALGGVLSTHP